MKILHGAKYPHLVKCPDCSTQKPPIKLEPGQLPLDYQQRASGEKPE